MEGDNMKKYSRMFILLVLFILFPKNVKAIACENEDMVKWQSLAKNLTISYDAVEKNGQVDFAVTFSNMQKGLIVLDTKTGKKYSYTKPEFTISGLKAKASYRYEIYTSEDSCDHTLLFTLYANVPAYNSYYKDAVCEGIETYELCKKWKDVVYDYDEWKAKVIEYKNSLDKKGDDLDDPEKNKTWIEKIIEGYGKIYYILLPIIIVVGSIIIYVYNKKRDLF